MNSEYETKQVSVILVRLEKRFERLEDNLVSKAEVQSIREDVKELQDNSKWLMRTAMGALVLAILDPLLRVFGAS